MRKSRAETAATRQRIVKAAARQFRGRGIAETGLSELMLAAGLETQGGFYKHFASKEQLVAEALQSSFDTLFAGMEASIRGTAPQETFARLVGMYLSAQHRDQVQDGCPLAALGSELRRANRATGEIAAGGIETFLTLLAGQMQELPRGRAHRKATAVLSAMVGAVMLSRLAKSTAVSNSILKYTREFILNSQEVA